MGILNPFRICQDSFTTQRKPAAFTPVSSDVSNSSTQHGCLSGLTPMKRSTTFSRLSANAPNNMRFAQAWQNGKTISLSDYSEVRKLGDLAVSKSSNADHLDFALGKIIALNLLEPVHHPYLIKPLGVARSETADSEIFAAEEYAGHDIESRQLQGKFKLTQQRALQMALAVETLHAKDLLHRNIKPNSFILSSDGGLVKLGDFSYTTRVTAATTTDVDRVHDVAKTLLLDAQLSKQQSQPRTTDASGLLKQKIIERMDTKNGISAMDYISPALVQGTEPVNFEKSDDIYSLGVTLMESALADIPEYFAHQILLTEHQNEPDQLTRYVNTLQTERLSLLSKASALAAQGKPHSLRNSDGQCLAKPFLDILHAMIKNPTQPKALRIQDINYFIKKLAKLNANEFYYQPNEPIGRKRINSLMPTN